MLILLQTMTMEVLFVTMQLIQVPLPMFCNSIHTRQQQVDVDGCHPTLTKSYCLGSGITAVDLPDSPVLIGQQEVPVIDPTVRHHVDFRNTSTMCFDVHQFQVFSF